MTIDRILVTGDRGYIGSVLVPMLVDRGYTVRGVDQRYYEACLFQGPMHNVENVHIDIRDLTVDHLRGFDTVIHLAALSNDPLGDINPELTFEINYRASVNLAKLAKDAGVKRFVFSSSCSTYGLASNLQLNEDSPLNPITPYGKSKVKAEKAIFKLASENFSPVFLRHATVYGLSPMLRFDLAVNNLTAYAVTTSNVLLKSDGSAWRPMIHVKDVAEACIAAAVAPGDIVHGQAFNIGQNSENYRIRDVAELIAATVPNAKVVFAPGASPDLRSYHIDFSKAKDRLPGFDPRITVQDGINELYSAFIQCGLKGNVFESKRYNRVEKLLSLLESNALNSILRWNSESLAAL